MGVKIRRRLSGGIDRYENNFVNDLVRPVVTVFNF